MAATNVPRVSATNRKIYRRLNRVVKVAIISQIIPYVAFLSSASSRNFHLFVTTRNCKFPRNWRTNLRTDFVSFLLSFQFRNFFFFFDERKNDREVVSLIICEKFSETKRINLFFFPSFFLRKGYLLIH